MLYVLLARLTDDGFERYRADPDLFADACSRVEVDGAHVLARYATLGAYDFVAMAEARDADCMARLSVELGATARVHIESLHAVSAHLLAEPSDESVTREAAAS